MPKQVRRRATAQPTPPPKDSTPERRMPSEIAGHEIKRACGWCGTRDHAHCVVKIRPDLTCECPCPKETTPEQAKYFADLYGHPTPPEEQS